MSDKPVNTNEIFPTLAKITKTSKEANPQNIKNSKMFLMMKAAKGGDVLNL